MEPVSSSIITLAGNNNGSEVPASTAIALLPDYKASPQCKNTKQAFR
jgi:hypothetical protein